MAITRYEKYIVREPLSWNTFPPFTPRLLFDTKNYFPEMNFGIRYTYINEPIHMERPHAHDFDQFLCFMGTPQDMRVFDGEVEIYLGEENAKNIINSTSVVYVPKGMVHCPIIWTRVSQPMMFVNIVLAASYTRSDQHAGYFDRIEITAKVATLAEAGRALGAAVPLPAYLPEGYQVQDIYTEGDSVRVLFSDQPIEKRLINVGDTGETRQQYAFQCKMGLTVRWYAAGSQAVPDIPGEPVKIGKHEGVLADREQHNELRWLLPGTSGKYEIVLASGKKMSRDELMKIAGSFAGKAKAHSNTKR
jgi:hypothetical protein